LASTFGEALQIQSRVIGALVLRDMRTRFGRTFFGYVVIVGWPLSHLFVMMGIYLLMQRVAPIGTSLPVFLATGILPYILCLYPGRMIMVCLAQNHALLYFPIVKPIDVVLGRGILEIVTAFWVTTIFALSLYIFGVDIAPLHYQEAIQAVIVTIFFGFSYGFIGAILFKLMRAWIAPHLLILVLMYVTSGVFFVPTNLPEGIQNIIWYNPLMHCVEWLRSAYYDDYGYGMLDRGYVIGFATVLFVVGLITERMVRGRVLSG
jgi:capsular polysaccharide transport system permease protein